MRSKMPDMYEKRGGKRPRSEMRKMHSKMVEKHHSTHKQPGGARPPFPRAESIDYSGVRKRRKGD